MKQKNKIKILIVDDDASIIDIFSIALRAEGFNVVTAANGQEGLKKAMDEIPDLILLDNLMPVMDGFTMLLELRKSNEYGKTVPVILLTNLSADNEDIVKKIAGTKPAYYIVKSSLTPKQVVAKVKEVLSSLP